MMCRGDGMADIMGRKFGSEKIPYNPRKSWAGSIFMFIFGFLISIGLLYYYSSLGYLHMNWKTTFQSRYGLSGRNSGRVVSHHRSVR
ncbi:unnamed protein product [Arabis nemorensis]|uniref:phytol kinase n=1 Tax=Arabis nemorensis TaxID=586526 RepID=A0A565CHK7_9BRAS|nr:unnamed protein product [Arabis nemorensis]